VERRISRKQICGVGFLDLWAAVINNQELKNEH